ncbi:MAG: GNAT family N-acetyltransferase [Treponema sp.]|nr:GNAT family N-acetyltransferase [Treponema sp.]
MLIKKCSLLDLKELAQLNKQLIEDEKSDNAMNLEQLQKRMQDFLKSEYDAYLFMEEDCTIGYALVRYTAKPLYLRQFFIARNFRRQGKGKAALKLLLDELKTDKIDIEVLSWNEAAIKFWESCGFTERSRYMRLENSESSFCIRKLSEADIPEALSLAWKVFTEYESPDYSDEGTASF